MVFREDSEYYSWPCLFRFKKVFHEGSEYYTWPCLFRFKKVFHEESEYYSWPDSLIITVSPEF